MFIFSAVVSPLNSPTMTSDTPNFDDPRISFDKAKQNWVLEGDDGSEMEWDVKFQRFVSVVRGGVLDSVHTTLTPI